MKMVIKSETEVLINGVHVFVTELESKIESFASAFNSAFESVEAQDISEFCELVGNVCENIYYSMKDGYTSEADQIDAIIESIREFGKFDDDNSEHDTTEDADVVVSVECMEMFEKTLDKASHPVMMGTEGKLACQPKESTMNVKKTLASVVVWYNKDTNKVSLAKCRATGKFVKLDVAQGLLNIELKTFRVPSVDTVKVDYSFTQTLVIVMLTLMMTGLSALAGVAIAEGLLLEAVFVASAVLGVGMLWAEMSEDHLQVAVGV